MNSFASLRCSKHRMTGGLAIWLEMRVKPHGPQTEDCIRFPLEFDMMSCTGFTGVSLPRPAPGFDTPDQAQR